MQPMTESRQIAVVIVTYHPSAEDTAFVAHMGELYHTVVVDNTNDNKGIAEAEPLVIPKFTYKITVEEDED